MRALRPGSGVFEKGFRESLITGPISFRVLIESSCVCQIGKFGGDGGFGPVCMIDKAVGFGQGDVRQVRGGELSWPCPFVDVFLIVSEGNDPEAVPEL